MVFNGLIFIYIHIYNIIYIVYIDKVLYKFQYMYLQQAFEEYKHTTAKGKEQEAMLKIKRKELKYVIHLKY